MLDDVLFQDKCLTRYLPYGFKISVKKTRAHWRLVGSTLFVQENMIVVFNNMGNVSIDLKVEVHVRDNLRK